MNPNKSSGRICLGLLLQFFPISSVLRRYSSLRSLNRYGSSGIRPSVGIQIIHFCLILGMLQEKMATWIHSLSTVYNVIALVFVFLGTVFSSDFVWNLQDLLNNFMVLPNVVALFALTGIVVKSARSAH